MIDLDAIEARLRSATPAPLRIGIYDPERDPVELFRENLSHGSGDVWLVGAPEHPDTVGGWEDRPGHMATVAITGNGPTSRANAEFFQHAAEDVAALLSEVRHLRSVLGQIPARWA